MSIDPIRSLLKFRDGQALYYLGPPLDLGPLPTVIYFALSGQASLYEDPFNQPALSLARDSIRCFSWNLPFHGGGLTPQEAMQKWAHEALHHPQFLFDFLEQSSHYVDEIIAQGWIDPNRLAVMGLSRGGFIATHFAAQDVRIKRVLGFAPLTHLSHLTEQGPLTKPLDDTLHLTSWLDPLIHKEIRYYIGNRDVRVGTDSCFEFIRTLVDNAYAKRIRSPSVEMIIYPSIGHKGHGTPPAIFLDGADWIKRQFFT